MKVEKQPYSQTKALWAITRASFKAIFANPSAIIFSILFPIIFILIFGAFGNGGGPIYNIAITANSDTTGIFYQGLKRSPSIRLYKYSDTVSLNTNLQKGKITAVLAITTVNDSLGRPITSIQVKSTTASANTLGSFMPMLDYLRLKIETDKPGALETSIRIEKPEVKEVRKYRQIDFILPGQLGFSILFSTLFGIAFTFFGLREQLVLKRFYASPVNRINILLGIGMSRLFFQLMNVIVLIFFGHYVLNFTLVNGFATAGEMLLVTVIMLFQLMGVGLIFSSISKSDTSIPLLINLYGFPQMMLSGTFFSIEVFPAWLQEICRVLPLTQYNDAMRKIAFEGLSIVDCWREIGILGIWMVVTYVIAVKVLKWE
ncbi:MAG TPA: ABC transporter permease [Chitinophagaceae bacterium]|nr:ABC transporter permease [Chitinophagaceae bacterium]